MGLTHLWKVQLALPYDVRRPGRDIRAASHHMHAGAPKLGICRVTFPKTRQSDRSADTHPYAYGLHAEGDSQSRS